MAIHGHDVNENGLKYSKTLNFDSVEVVKKFDLGRGHRSDYS